MSCGGSRSLIPTTVWSESFRARIWRKTDRARWWKYLGRCPAPPKTRGLSIILPSYDTPEVRSAKPSNSTWPYPTFSATLALSLVQNDKPTGLRPLGSSMATIQLSVLLFPVSLGGLEGSPGISRRHYKERRHLCVRFAYPARSLTQLHYAATRGETVLPV